ncbi:MAG: tail fiber domain-containing protein, partial [Saprospiraceae bacterium]
NTVATTTNKSRIGNTMMTVIEGQVAWSFPSDARFKYNVKNDVPGLDFIQRLRPVTYQFDLAAFNSFIMPDGWQERMDEKNLSKWHAEELTHSEVIQSGFIAQEVEAAAHEIGYDFDGVVKPQNEKDNYGLRYAEFVVPLVKAVQELSSQNNELKKQNDELLKRIEKLESLLTPKK